MNRIFPDMCSTAFGLLLLGLLRERRLHNVPYVARRRTAPDAGQP